MPSPEARRIQHLLTQLTTRAVRCPGLTPLREADDFLALARWHAGTREDGPVATALECLWRHPEEASCWINRLLLQSGAGTGPILFNSSEGEPAWKPALAAALRRAA